ncbi:glycosyltransferase [Ureibacillus chungkukjangi]|uniref:glycosyltransferase family 2 protein n=1 Tax=Ureibacillus chungkukjangi TaxID=1202712 RepID=UPI00384E0930
MISCIITTYNRPVSILKRAIHSIKEQTYKDIEIIIVNDYPQDYILEIAIKNLINEYRDLNIAYISHEYNKGACAARNTGIDIAAGEFIAFLDDDDEWLPGKLETQIKYFTSNDIGLVYCDNYIISKSGKSLHKNVPKTSEESKLKNLLLANFIGSTSFPLLSKTAVLESGKFDEKLKSAQDLDLWIRIAERFECVYCELPLVNYYIMNESITTNVQHKIEGYEYFLKKYNRYFENNINFYNKKLNTIAGELLMSGVYDKSLFFYKQALQKKWNSIYNIYFPLRSGLLRARRLLKGY